MILNRFAVPALALFLGATGLATARAAVAPAVPLASGYGQDRGEWDAPPQELQEVQRRGFHDGIEGARRDADNHRRPDVSNRDEFRHPNVPRYQREAYRDGFRRGYEVGVSHLMGGPGRQMGEGDRQMREPYGGGQNMAPAQGSEIQRRGFQDGMEGARKDLDNHRRPDPNNRDEFRNPRVPRGLQGEYREAFRHGYEQAMTQRTDGPDRH